MKFEFENKCDKEWDEMKGGDKRRYCDSCDKHVHHISSMTKEQALKFLNDRNWDVCVDFFADGEGNTEFREKSGRLGLQMDGVKQLVASALAVVPLALAAAFIDFDHEPAAEPQTFVEPLSLDGPSPLVVAPPIETFIAPDPVEPLTVLDLPETVLEPFVETPEPAVIAPVVQPDEPAIPPRHRLRGKIRRPTPDRSNVDTLD